MAEKLGIPDPNFLKTGHKLHFMPMKHILKSGDNRGMFIEVMIFSCFSHSGRTVTWVKHCNVN